MSKLTTSKFGFNPKIAKPVAKSQNLNAAYIHDQINEVKTNNTNSEFIQLKTTLPPISRKLASSSNSSHCSREKRTNLTMPCNGSLSSLSTSSRRENSSGRTSSNDIKTNDQKKSSGSSNLHKKNKSSGESLSSENAEGKSRIYFNPNFKSSNKNVNSSTNHGSLHSHQPKLHPPTLSLELKLPNNKISQSPSSHSNNICIKTNKPSRMSSARPRFHNANNNNKDKIINNTLTSEVSNNNNNNNNNIISKNISNVNNMKFKRRSNSITKTNNNLNTTITIDNSTATNNKKKNNLNNTFSLYHPKTLNNKNCDINDNNNNNNNNEEEELLDELESLKTSLSTIKQLIQNDSMWDSSMSPGIANILHENNELKNIQKKLENELKKKDEVINSLRQQIKS